MALNALALVFCPPPKSWEAFSNTPRPTWCIGPPSGLVPAEHTPRYDQELPAELLIENLDLAVHARSTFVGQRDFRASFFNDVCPTPSSMNAVNLGSPICSSAYATSDQLHHRRKPHNLESRVLQLVNVHYNTKRRHQPKSQRIHRTRHGHLHWLVDLAGRCLPQCWRPGPGRGRGQLADQRGNHTWVEIHDGERWRFLAPMSTTPKV